MTAPHTLKKESPKVHFWFQVLVCIFLIAALTISGCKYSQEPEEDGAFLLTLLFSIPPFLQIIGLWVLYHKLLSDRKVWKFYWYCLILIFPCVLTEAVLWWLYPGKLAPGEFLHYLPLFLLIIFIIPVGGMTYSLLESSSGDDSEGHTSSWWRKLRDHALLLKGLKNSVSQVPFCALLFFFSYFLSITYLLVFAFAFHGKRELPDPNNKEDFRVPALYLAKKYSADTKEQKDLRDEVGKSSYRSRYQMKLEQNAPAQNDEYTFYFDADSAYMIGSDFPSKGDGWSWKKERNEKQLNKLADYIMANTSKGEKIRIQLKGQTDDNLPNTKKYPNNQALSEARATNMRFAVLKKLSEKDGATQKWRDIEWHYAGLSNEVLPETIPSEDFHKRIGPLRNKVSPTSQENMKKVTNRLGEVEALDRGKTKLSPHDGDWLISLLEKASDIAAKLASSGEAESSGFDKAINDFDEAVKYVTFLDKNARKRVVVASIAPFEPVEAPVKPEYTRLKLLDYMYFTAYTITTTGYGDIVPTSNYAKFLCTLGNFMAVFFLVVFFNVLLSIRKGEQILSPAHEKFEAIGGTGEVHVHLKPGLHWKVECHNPDVDHNMLIITSDKSGHGSGIVRYRVSCNNLSDSRAGRITIAGETFWVKQAGSPCSFEIEDTDGGVIVPAKGKTQNKLKVKTTDDCTWQASTLHPEMITIKGAGEMHKGPAEVSYSVAANQGSEREGAIFIGGLKHTIRQKGAQKNSAKDKQT